MKLPDRKTSCDIEKNGFQRAETTWQGPACWTSGPARPGPFCLITF